MEFTEPPAPPAVPQPELDPRLSDLIHEVILADEHWRLSKTQLRVAVATARAHGVSWQSLGDALGISRQAAFKKFDTAHGQSIGEPPMSQSPINLIERTEHVFLRLEASDYEAVKTLMTYSCARVLTKRKVMAVWAEVLSSTGRLESCSQTTAQSMGGRNVLEKVLNQRMATNTVVQTRLEHEAGEWIGRVAYNGSGKITGLLIAPVDSANLPF
jgi:hypothetical protein